MTKTNLPPLKQIENIVTHVADYYEKRGIKDQRKPIIYYMTTPALDNQGRPYEKPSYMAIYDGEELPLNDAYHLLTRYFYKMRPQDRSNAQHQLLDAINELRGVNLHE